ERAADRFAARAAHLGAGLRSGAPSAVRVVAYAVQLALPRNRRRHRRERPQHAAGSRSVNPQRRSRTQRPDPRPVLRTRAALTGTGAPRLLARDRARPLALSDPARPQARAAERAAGVVPRGRRPALPAW